MGQPPAIWRPCRGSQLALKDWRAEWGILHLTCPVLKAAQAWGWEHLRGDCSAVSVAAKCSVGKVACCGSLTAGAATAQGQAAARQGLGLESPPRQHLPGGG